jgi:hypothetical protein
MGAERSRASHQGRKLGGSGNTPGVTPTPLLTAAMIVGWRWIGAAIAGVGQTHAAQQPLPGA